MFGLYVKSNPDEAMKLLKEALSVPVINSEVKWIKFYYKYFISTSVR